MRRPLLISGLMTIVFLVLEGFHLNFLLTLGLATGAYVGFASLLIFRKSGGVSL